jgi:prepilin-type N-terminal cleavage/methylation domain-containing protein
MAALQLHRRKPDQRGFTLIEVLGAIFILSFGLLALAGYMASMSVSTNQSRYMQVAAMLASEKLEDLNRIPNTDPAMTTAGGSLTSNVSPATFSNGEVFAYNDQVLISTDNGAANEVIAGASTTGVTGYWTISNSPSGTSSSVWTAGTPTITSDMLIFQRQWTIEVNAPITGVRRVTVLVSLISPTDTGGRSANFQASMVRP